MSMCIACECACVCVCVCISVCGHPPSPPLYIKYQCHKSIINYQNIWNVKYQLQVSSKAIKVKQLLESGKWKVPALLESGYSPADIVYCGYDMWSLVTRGAKQDLFRKAGAKPSGWHHTSYFESYR